MPLQRVLEFAADYAPWLVAGSVLSLAIGCLLGPWLILQLPADYFTWRRRHAELARRGHPVRRAILTSAKNLVGAILVVAGFCLFFLPGQGLITLVAGLVVMNYPGKFRLERWLIRRPKVLPALNWFRQRYGREPLLAPERAHGGDPRPEPERDGR